MTKTDKIRGLLAEGVAVTTIAKRVKVSPSYVYSLRNKRKAKRAVKRVQKDVVVPVTATADPLDVQVGGDHYKSMKIQPVQFIVANGLGFLEGCIVKRISRWKVKDGVQDLEKIKHEVDLLIAAQQ